MPKSQNPRRLALTLTILVAITGILTLYRYLALGSAYTFKNFDSENVSGETANSTTPYSISPFVQNLEVPWSLVFTGSDRMLVTERKGTIRVVQDGKLLPKPLATFPEVQSKSEEGLMGLAIDPNYPTNRLVYACLAYPRGSEIVDKVVRFRDDGDRISNLTTLLDQIPAAQYHAGCRLKFGPDGMLYISTGDATDGKIAQDLKSLGGKMLRIHSDGSIPTDNPFPNSPVWSYGHRNAQGFDWQPGTTDLYNSEHGPSGFDGPGGGDEINRIEKGGNFGWPLVSHGKTREGTIPAIAVFTPAIAPAGALFYTGTKIPQFTGNLLVTALRGEGIYRFIFSSSNPSKLLRYEKLPDVNLGRIRDIIQGPDGFIYFATSNRDGRGTPAKMDDAIYRLAPSE